MASRGRGVSIRLFLAEGTPDGLWLVEKSNWTGLGLVLPRSGYAQARTRVELTRPGVYVLVGPSETVADRQRVYVGEADVLGKRLDQHQASKDFWTKAVVFTSKDQNLNKAHVRYLESRLLTLASEAGRCEVDNANAPGAPSLSEAEAAEMDVFLDEMLVLFPVLDVQAFERIAEEVSQRLRAGGPHAQAEGADTPDGFIVFAGSLARKATVPSIHRYMLDIREQLLAEGTLVDEGESLRFTRDFLFNSPSTAAGVVLGRTANGRLEWKDGQGRTLRDIGTAALTGP